MKYQIVIKTDNYTASRDASFKWHNVGGGMCASTLIGGLSQREAVQELFKLMKSETKCDSWSEAEKAGASCRPGESFEYDVWSFTVEPDDTWFDVSVNEAKHTITVKDNDSKWVASLSRHDWDEILAHIHPGQLAFSILNESGGLNDKSLQRLENAGIFLRITKAY